MKHANVSIFVPDAGCPHRCSFCNQKTISGALQMPTHREIEETLQTAIRSGADPKTTEIAFFGGSFTCIDRVQMETLLQQAAAYVRAGHFSGIRISTRPDGIDEDVLSCLKTYGVTAIELGCQSMDDTVLRLNERGHTADDTVRACRLIHDFGFSLGVQMMTGLPGDTAETAVATARQLLALRPDTARIYPAVVLAGTRLAEWYRAGLYRAQTLDEAVALCSRLLLLFEENGVRVIRLGLHSGGNVEDGFLAGPYHPAFRELCDNRIYLTRAKALLQALPHGDYTLNVGAAYLSQALGQKKSNLLQLENAGYRVRFCTVDTLKRYELTLN